MYGLFLMMWKDFMVCMIGWLVVFMSGMLKLFVIGLYEVLCFLV